MFIDEMDPVKQDWYLTAQTFVNRVILTRPRIDPGGAGYIFTVSKEISANPKDDRADFKDIVMGMDLTTGYINKMLLDTIPICNNLLNDGVRCFLFDHHGYLLVHPTFFGEFLFYFSTTTWN